MSPHVKLLIEIERVFDFFNERFCNGELKKPLILFSPSEGIPVSGWFGVASWKVHDEDVCEINISAEYLHREPFAIIGTLVHEMAHLKNHQAGIVDCNLDTQYHNECFKIAAESLGLKVKKGKKGYAYTDLGPLAVKAIHDCQLDTTLFKIYRKDQFAK